VSDLEDTYTFYPFSPVRLNSSLPSIKITGFPKITPGKSCAPVEIKGYKKILKSSVLRYFKKTTGE